MRRPIPRRTAPIAPILALEGLENRVVPTAFTPGNLLVLRVGDGSATVGTSAAAVSLVEVTPAGVVRQTVALDNTGALATTLRGSATTEGLLSRSPDGHLVTFGAYRVDAGAANPSAGSGAASGQVPRVIGVVPTSGVAGVGQAIGVAGDQSFWNDSIRSVVTTDGTSFWVSGGAQLGANGGVRYVGSAGATGSTALTASGSNTRQLQIVNGNLFAGSATATPGRSVYQVGSGLPTSGTPTLTATYPVAGATLVNSFFFADLSPAKD